MKKQNLTKNSADLARATSLMQSGQLGLAEQFLEKTLAKIPLKAEAYLLLGDIRLKTGQYQRAADAYQQSLAYRVSVESLSGLADAAGMMRLFDVTEKCLRSIVKMLPKAGEAYFKLAHALHEQAKSAEEIIACLQQSIALGYRPADAYRMIGLVAQDRLRDRDLSRASYLKALEIDPRHVPSMLGLAHLYWTYNHTDLAMDLLFRAMEIDDQQADVFQLLSASFLKLGKHDECRKMFRRALDLAPDDWAVWSSYLFSTNYSDALSKLEWFEEHRKYGETIQARVTPMTEYLGKPDPQRKLRVGYVSADFRRHPVAFFFEPIVEHHDRQQFEIYCYYNHFACDDVTLRLKDMADCWRDVRSLNDEELAQQIHADQIDILMDLTGHTADNRLPVFAWKPAPIQFTWLGYVVTTGMSSIDYIFTDRHYTPDAEAESYYSEKPVYLSTYRVFRPEADLPVGELPALSKGYVTFGSFNSFIKISEQVLALWARLLNEIPDSRLSIIVAAKESVDYVKAFFAERGVAEERLMIFNRLSMSHFLQLHNHVDVALDSFPFTGFTTSFHGLWMGVPMITMVGNRIVSRSGLSLLAPLGLEEFAVYSQDEYIEKAKYWVQNLHRLADIRAGLRDQLRNSTLMDEISFTRDFEAGFRRCWQDWCAKQ